MEFVQIFDDVAIDRAPGPMVTSGMCGTWINTNPDTNGIARMIISESEGCVSLQAVAVGTDGLIDWGKADLQLFASTPTSRVCAGSQM